MAFVSLVGLPLNIPLFNQGNLSDSNLTTEMIAAINQFLNSEEHKRKLLAMCEKRGIVRCKVERISSGGFCLVNRQPGVGPGRTMGLYTGLYVDSFESGNQKQNHHDGVFTNRKVSAKIEVRKKDGNIWGGWLEFEIILVGWRADDGIGILNRIDPEICGGAEFCQHSCNPNCHFATAARLSPFSDGELIDEFIVGGFNLRGDRYQFRYTPLFLESRVDIPVGSTLTCDYGDDLIYKPNPYVDPEEFYELRNQGMSKREMRQHFSNGCKDPFQRDRALMTRKYGFSNLLPGIDCLCDFCIDAEQTLGRCRSVIFTQDKNGINYKQLHDMLFDRSLPVPRRPVQIQFNDPSSRNFHQRVIVGPKKGGFSFRQALMTNVDSGAERKRINDRRKIGARGVLVPSSAEQTTQPARHAASACEQGVWVSDTLVPSKRVSGVPQPPVQPSIPMQPPQTAADDSDASWEPPDVDAAQQHAGGEDASSESWDADSDKWEQ
jgi:hypothetical protein